MAISTTTTKTLANAESATVRRQYSGSKFENVRDCSIKCFVSGGSFLFYNSISRCATPKVVYGLYKSLENEPGSVE